MKEDGEIKEYDVFTSLLPSGAKSSSLPLTRNYRLFNLLPNTSEYPILAEYIEQSPPTANQNLQRINEFYLRSQKLLQLIQPSKTKSLRANKLHHPLELSPTSSSRKQLSYTLDSLWHISRFNSSSLNSLRVSQELKAPAPPDTFRTPSLIEHLLLLLRIGSYRPCFQFHQVVNAAAES